MDILFVISQLSGGGSQNVLKQVAKSFVSKGKKVSILNLESNNLNQINIPEEINIISPKYKKHYFFGKLNFINEIIYIRNVIKKNKPKITFGFIARTNIILLLASLYLNETIYISERNDPKKQNIGLIKSILRRYLYNKATIVTYNSKNALHELKNYVDDDKLVYLPNPIKENDKISFRNIKQFSKKSFFYVGKSDHQKGLDILIRAFGKFSQKEEGWTLNIIGDSYNCYLSELKKLEKKLEVKNIFWLDYQNDISQIFFKYDIFILPSRYEGMPNVLLEAMSYGKPIICSDSVEEAFNYLKDNNSALFFLNEDCQDLANKMLLLAKDENLKEKLINNVKKTDLSENINALDIWYNELFCR